MITYWCSKKNSIKNWIEKGINFVPSMVPCLKSDCEHWRDGECIHLISVGKTKDIISPEIKLQLCLRLNKKKNTENMV
jgi:hypothetical protein